MYNRVVEVQEDNSGTAPDAVPLTMLLAEEVVKSGTCSEDDGFFTYETTGAKADVSWDSG